MIAEDGMMRLVKIVCLIIIVSFLRAEDIEPFLISIGNIEYTQGAISLAVDDQDRIFVANKTDGLSVYTFNVIQGFAELAHINDGGSALDVEVSSDGRTVFLANENDGLRIYSFDEDNLQCIYHMAMNTEGGECTVIHAAQIIGVLLHDESLLSVISYTKWEDTMRPRIYEYGSVSTSIWEQNTLSSAISGLTYPRDPYDGFPGRISDYEKYDQNTDIIACGSDGIKMVDGPRISTGNFVRDIHVMHDKTILSANGTLGLMMHRYDEQFLLLDHIYEGGKAYKICEHSSGTIFLANGSDGIRAYDCDTSFHFLAHADDGGNARDIVELSDGTLILANELGLVAYSFYTPEVNVEDNFILNSNYPNPFNDGTKISFLLPEQIDASLEIYNIQGHRVRTWDLKNLSIGLHEQVWDGTDQNGNSVPSGVFIYRMIAGEFVESKKMLMLK